ncbi:MAG TPA: ABC transporter ATP-binding protein [Hyphomicrobiaceae bacterium]|nr:ABC transporter ATP-binding protein [Hyphomicrobiaceae bacterium]
MARVRLQNLVKQFGTTEVIRDVTLDIADGEFVVFVGPSGCGKSTLLRLIAGLEQATSGTIYIGDDDVTALPPAKRGVSMVFQSYALYPHMDAYRNISFGLKLPDACTESVDQRVRRVAEKLQISDLLDRKPRELSGGQRQRVAIARAIVREPRVFLFDEPLSNLDAALRAQTRLEIARLHDELSSTMIYVTHDQQEAMTLADRIALLDKGRIEQVGAPTELYRQPASRFVAEFLGSPAMNILPAKVSGGDALLATGERIAVNTHYSGPADIGIRPEALTQASQGEPGTVQARVLHIEDLGESRLLHAALSDGTVVAARYFGAAATPSKGERIAFRLEPHDLHLFGEDGRRI